nr:penicillin acylase family protein [Paraoerskovia sediminicola]
MAIVVVLALVAVTVFSVVVLRRPLPDTGGDLTLGGLQSDVTVQRDAQGVPTITASSDHDLFMAQGYVQAQDRFFEMDYRRHVTSGRLAELVGDQPEAIAADKVTRTFGWRDVAEQEWELVSPETRAYLQAYAQGVNAYLEGRDTGAIAVEYTVLGLQVDVEEPEPWDPIDSLAWLKAMAWDLRGNYDDELDRALSYGTLRDVELVDELFPPYDAEAHTPILDPEEVAATVSGAEEASAPVEDDALALADDEVTAALRSASDALAAVPVLVGRGEDSGSNSWVVSGEHTESGQPLLANDPHLALGAPSIWAQVGLQCSTIGPDCTFDVSGFSFAGFPGVFIGHNDQLAWGLTNMGADVTDFFVERVEDGSYLKDDEWIPLESRPETIHVNGGSDESFIVHTTEHGPVVSGVLSELNAAMHVPSDDVPVGGTVVSLGWTALTPGRTADAVFALGRAADAADVQAAAELFEVPAQNIVFATIDGHIGYQAPGRIPIRKTVSGALPSDGSWPRPGWDSRYDWTGYVDPADMPRVLDPAEGFIVAANQAVQPRSASPFLTTDWDFGYRSERIRTLLEGKIADGGKVGVADMQEIQLDDWSPFAEALVPALLSIDVGEGFDADGQALLEDWDYGTGVDSAPAAYFAAVWSNILELTFWDDVPPSMRPAGSSQSLAVVEQLLERPADQLWDDRSTVGLVETRDEILKDALVSARAEMTTQVSKRPTDWAWGKVHQLRLEHPVLGGPSIPGVVRSIVNPDPVGMPGGSSIVNAVGWDAAAGTFDVTAGPSMRMVVDLGNLDASTWVTVTGVSGHPASPHYDDQLDAWATGETYAWPFSSSAVDGAAQDEATLRP